MAFKFNPFTSKLDWVVDFADDTLHVLRAGDTMTGALVITPLANGTSILDINQTDGTAVFDVDTTNRRIVVTSGTTGQSTLDAGLIINNLSGSDEINDFLVKTLNYNAIDVDAGDNTLLLMSNALGKVGFFGTAPTVQSTGWAVTNVSSDKVYDANATSIDELADVLGSLITELLAKGLIGA